MAYRKGNWKAKSKEEKQKELDDLIALSNKKIEQYQADPKEMAEFAKFMSRIHNYSPLNLSLIDEQFKGAIAVASYEGWQKLGFQVQKGERGIGIYAHAPVTIFIDENGEQKTLREATKEEKIKIQNGELTSRKIEHFKKGYVFDVSQTNATEADLPKIFPNRVWNFKIDDISLVQLEKGVADVADKLNISIQDMKESTIGELGTARGAYVQYLDGKEEIALNSRNSRTQNLAVSIHELAHKRLHNKNEKGSEYSTPVKEFQAEMTSFVVCNNYGIDTSEQTIPYIASWTKNNEKINPKEFRQIMKEVSATAMEFIETIDKRILDEQQKLDLQYTNVVGDLNNLRVYEDIEEIATGEVGFANRTIFHVLSDEGYSLGVKEDLPLSEDELTNLENGIYLYDNTDFDKDSLIFAKNAKEMIDKITDLYAFNNPNNTNKDTITLARWYDFSGVTEEFGLNPEATKIGLETAHSYVLSKANEQTQENSEINNELEQGSKWVISKNETGEGIPSLEGQVVTLDLLDKIKEYDQASIDELRYYKFYFDKIQDGEVVIHHRIDIGDGLAVNQDFYDFIEKELSQENQVQNQQETESEKADNAQKNSFTIGQNENDNSKEQKQENSEINNEPEQGYKWVIEFNETGEGMPSYTGQTVTPELLETIKGYDQSLPYEQGYYKFYFDKIQDGEVVAHERIDVGDGLAVNQDFYDFIEKELSQENQVQKEIADEPLRAVAIAEATFNLSDSATQYYNASNWHDELVKQSDINSIEDLNICSDSEKFYDSHKQEIENTITDFDSAVGMNFRSTLNEQNYKEMTATLAYKVVATNVKNEIENGSFEIPKHTSLQQPVAFEPSNSFEME
ncbi:ArdC-like ssDNA-binding domain-containing protein [Clostridium perfringens]|uniref:ArdC-like ssDNA-binding domain-containing protein n=1 Tax=Clostridium perfringens TaxID=1502 RepID=UPI0024BC9045|nr:ArdC-like ssDNA-binding domain-containing protein [Clostridium perfringens]